jgi:hypothetical protein
MATIPGTSGPDNLVGVNGEPNDIFGNDVDPSGGGFIGADDTLTGGKNSEPNNLYGDAHSFCGRQLPRRERYTERSELPQQPLRRCLRDNRRPGRERHPHRRNRWR